MHKIAFKISFLFFLLIQIPFQKLPAQIKNQRKLYQIDYSSKNDSLLNEIFISGFQKFENNRWGDAKKIADNAIEVFKKRKNYRLVAQWYDRLGFLYQKHDVYTLALDVFYRGLKYTKNLPVEKAKLYNDIARVYLALNFDLYHAEKYLLTSLKEQEKIKDVKIKKSLNSYTYNQLGVVYERRGKFDVALKHYKIALRIRTEEKDTVGLVNSYYTLAYYFSVVNNQDSALYYYDKGLAIVKNPDYKISYLLNKANILAQKDNFDQALKNIDEAMSIAQEKSKTKITEVLKVKSEVFDYAMKTEEAAQIAEQALAEAENYNQPYLKLQIYSLLISYNKKLGDYKKVSNYQSKYLNYYRNKEKEKSKIIKDYILEKEDSIIRQLEKDRKILQQSNRYMYFLIVGLLFLVALSAFLAIYYFKHKQELNKTSLEIKTQAVIARILRNITGKERSIEEFLQDALVIILDIPWLRFETKGAIFLTTNEGNLKMVAHKNLGAPLLKMCAIVKPGECLCGKTLKHKKTFYKAHIDDAHDFHPDGMKPHGHYNVPLMFQDKVLGVLTLYLKNGHKQKDYEIKFLETIAASIASVINRKSIQDKLKQQAIEQEKLNQKLFAQKLELEQRNIEIQQYSKQQDALNQKFFAQTLELDQRNIEIQQYSKKLEEQKKAIELAHKDLTDSITYAQTIQEALLPKPEQLDNLFNDYFVIYLPKQVVSGDFYYAQKVGDKLAFTVADCTGHGVPGGFITMLGITFISELIHNKELNSSAQILEILRTNIKGIFAEFGTKNTNGFDIAFCVIDTKTNILSYAGAYNSLYIIRNGELLEFKATKNPIGWHPKEMPFKEEKVQLQNNDKIYLFSDGYYDQIGENKKKFLRKRFKMLLTEVHDLPMKEQKRILKGIFDKWKGKEDQTDDVTIFGINWKI